jgi:dihydroxyacetone kinase-like protein
MNFELAAEMARAEGIEVTSVVIADDVAVKDSLYTAGRRGVGGTVLAEKIVGAAAEAGADLAAVTALCQKVQDNVRSMGMALTSCTVPAAGKPTFDLGDDEMEFGVGIHGEPGRTRMKVASAAEITSMLATPILDDLPFVAGDKVLAFVNGMGGTPHELYVVSRSQETRGGGRSPATWSATTSPCWRWPVADHAAPPRRRADGTGMRRS